MYRYSGTGVEQVANIGPLERGSFPSQLTAVGDKLVFRADDFDHGNELRVVDVATVVSWSQTAVTVSESDSSMLSDVHLVRNGSLDEELTVDLRVVGGTADLADDYTVWSRVTFLPGDDSVALNFMVSIVDDSEIERDESIELQVETGAVGIQGVVSISIVDDDRLLGDTDLSGDLDILDMDGLVGLSLIHI